MANRYWRGGTGTWNTSSTTNWSTTSGGTGGASVPTAADSVFFDQAGTYTVTMTGTLSCLDINVSAGVVSFITGTTPTLSIAGSMSLISGTVWSSTGLVTFTATGVGKTITTGGTTIGASVTFSGFDNNDVWTLQDAFTIPSTSTLTFLSGTISLNNKSLTTGFFVGNGPTYNYTINFGTSGSITCTGAGGTVWSVATTNGSRFKASGATRTVNISYSGASPVTINSYATASVTTTSSVSFNFTAGTYTLTFLATSLYAAKNVDFTGFSGTWNNWAGSFIYGSLTLSSTMATPTSANTLYFSSATEAPTSGTITSNGKTIDAPVTVTDNGSGVSLKLLDAMTLGSTRLLDHTQGTFDLNGQTLTTGRFRSVGTNTRTIAFGTGNIVCNSSTGGTVWDTSTITGLGTAGTQIVNIPVNGSSVTVLSGSLSQANSISFNFTSPGAGNVTFLSVISETARNINFTGFTGAWVARTVGSTIYGNLTLSSGMTYSASTGTMSFAGTSGTQTITTNAKTIDQPLTFNAVGGTFQLQDALLMGSTRLLNHVNGTFDLNGKTLTVGTAYATAGSGTKDITFNGGTLVCPAATTTAFNNAVPTGFTTTAGTGTGKISMTAATAKTFVGGGSTFNCTLSNDGAGALTISGANTFTTIANGVQPTSFVFPIATTQTVTNWNVSGTAGNLVTITSGTAGTPALLSKASGTVSSNYLSLKDSTATGGATWYAGANSTNVSGNLGWIFTAPPATNTGNFFFMF